MPRSEAGSDVGADQLRDELERLRAELEERSRQAAEKELQLERYAADLRETFKEERARAEQLTRSYIATVTALTNAVEARDAYTGKHAERVAGYGLELAGAMAPGLRADPQTEFGFLLHDIGKVAVPDGILHKPGPLTDKERAVMRHHPVIGWEILKEIEFLGGALPVVRHHHERWDGQGYPDGLGGEEIPLAARVFAVADTLDALTTDRPYRPARPLSAARTEIASARGGQLDPQVVDAFEQVPDERLAAIADGIG